jgi:hypothetical protein
LYWKYHDEYDKNEPPAHTFYLINRRGTQWEREGWTLKIENDTYYRTLASGEEGYYHVYPLENVLNLTDKSGNQYNWSSKQLPSSLETHEIIIDMQEDREIKGFRFDQVADKALLPFAQGTIQVFLATEAAPDSWEQAFHNPITQVGTGLAETTINYMDVPKDVRYIKLQIKDVVGDPNNAVSFDNFYPLFE